MATTMVLPTRLARNGWKPSLAAQRTATFVSRRMSTARSGHAGRPSPTTRADYKAFRHVTTRWGDNDVYGHINNVVYYSWFDSAVNSILIDQGVLSIEASPVIGLVVETGCHYFSPLSYPQPVDVGVKVAHLGTSSVRYAVGIFAGDHTGTCAAHGHFVHVYVDRETRRPVPLPPSLRHVLETLQ